MDWKKINPLYWPKSLLLLILVGFVIIWFAFFDTYSLLTRYQLSERKEELRQKTEQLKAETAELKEKIKDFKSNPALLERIAREEYGMHKEGETVYKIHIKKD